jgi:hypothetical protein
MEPLDDGFFAKIPKERRNPDASAPYADWGGSVAMLIAWSAWGVLLVLAAMVWIALDD